MASAGNTSDFKSRPGTSIRNPVAGLKRQLELSSPLRPSAPHNPPASTGGGTGSQRMGNTPSKNLHQHLLQDRDQKDDDEHNAGTGSVGIMSQSGSGLATGSSSSSSSGQKNRIRGSSDPRKRAESGNLHAEDEPDRTFDWMGGDDPSGQASQFTDNSIRTSKYQWITFPLANLFEQFRRVANLYFLVISAMMLIGWYFPEVYSSPLSPFSTLGPLIAVLGITMAKEGFEDSKRHASDAETNNRKADVLTKDGDWDREVAWKDIRVGDVLRIKGGRPIPADLVMINSSKPDGSCYIETSNIDGETDLKGKASFKALQAACPSEPGGGLLVDRSEARSIKKKGIESNQDIAEPRRRALLRKQESVMMDADEVAKHDKQEQQASGAGTPKGAASGGAGGSSSSSGGNNNNDDDDSPLSDMTESLRPTKEQLEYYAGLQVSVTAMPPNAQLYKYTGRFEVKNENKKAPSGESASGRQALGYNNVLLRGCTLRNTHWVMGVVMQTGSDTKVMKKAGVGKAKLSNVEKIINLCIGVIFGAQLLLSVISDIAVVIWEAQNEAELGYLMLGDFDLLIPDWIGNLFTFIILYNNCIPISLYVTVEMVNYLQAMLVGADSEMYDPETDTPAKARTSNLNQDLGQIEYVFSDKTGTLTRNVMEFKVCSIKGVQFGKLPDLDEPSTDDGDAHSSRDGRGKRNRNNKRRLRPAGSREPARISQTSRRSSNPVSISGSVNRNSFSERERERKQGGDEERGGAGSHSHSRSDSGSKQGGGRQRGRTRRASSVGVPELRNDKKFKDAGMTNILQGRRQTAAGGSPRGAEGKGSASASCKRQDVDAFLTVLTVCHTVVPEQVEVSGEDGEESPGAQESGNSGTGGDSGGQSGGQRERSRTGSSTNDGGGSTRTEIVYQAESPDEGALVGAAKDMGYVLERRTNDGVTVRVDPMAGGDGEEGERLFFKSVGVNKFSSKRKRMSVITVDPRDDEYWLYCKGADSAMLNIGDLKGTKLQALKDDLRDFAASGLRTLVIARRRMSKDEVEEWQERHKEADEDVHHRDEMLHEVAVDVEKDLEIVGATAIEDRLQEGVPGTIADLARAGIKTWVLTGDKVETAINIGRTCRLLTEDLGEPMVVDGESRERVVDQLERFNQLLDAMEFDHDIDGAMRVAYPDSSPRAEQDEEEGGGQSGKGSRGAGASFGSGSRGGASSGAAAAIGIGRGGRGKGKGKGKGKKLHSVVSPVHGAGGRVVNGTNGTGNGAASAITFSSSPRGPVAPSSSSQRHASSAPLRNDQGAPPAAASAASGSGSAGNSGAAQHDYNPDEDVEDLDCWHRMLHACGLYVPGRQRKFLKPVRLPRALVITGPSLDLLLEGKDTEEEERLVLSVGLRCQAVIACRVSPKQKADIVGLVRHCTHPKPMTLAIGDGANDVAMIQNAQIGVGISGREGLQAANAADFSISQFRFLRRLLLIHGRWSYRRMSKVLLYSFYKNIVITITLFLYNVWAGYSGTSLYESLVYSIFNFVLGLPIIACGVLDQDVREETVLAHPGLYMSGLNNMDLTVGTMAKWIVQAFVHGIVVFYIPFGAFYATGTPMWSADGKVDGIDVGGFAIYSALIWAMQLKVALITDSWTWVHWFFMGLSQFGFYLFVLCYSLLLSISPQWYYVAIEAVQRPAYWFAWILGMAVVGIFDVLVVYYNRQQSPTTPQVAAELDNEEQGDGWCDEGKGAGACEWGDSGSAMEGNGTGGGNSPGRRHGSHSSSGSGGSGGGGLKGGDAGSMHSSHHQREERVRRLSRGSSGYGSFDDEGGSHGGAAQGMQGGPTDWGNKGTRSRSSGGVGGTSIHTGQSDPAAVLLASAPSSPSDDRAGAGAGAGTGVAGQDWARGTGQQQQGTRPMAVPPAGGGNVPRGSAVGGPLSVVSEETAASVPKSASIVSSIAPGSLVSQVGGVTSDSESGGGAGVGAGPRTLVAMSRQHQAQAASPPASPLSSPQATGSARDVTSARGSTAGQIQGEGEGPGASHGSAGGFRMMRVRGTAAGSAGVMSAGGDGPGMLPGTIRTMSVASAGGTGAGSGLEDDEEQ